MSRRSKTNHINAQTNPHEEVNNDNDNNDDIDGDVDNVNDNIVDSADVEIIDGTDDDSRNELSNNDDSNIKYTNFYNNLMNENDSDNDSDNDSEIDQDEFNDWKSIQYPSFQFNLCNYADQHYSTFIVGEEVEFTKLERAVYKLNLLSNQNPCLRLLSDETKKEFLQNIKCVQKLADEQNMNTKKNWSVTFGDFFILPPNGHFIPQVKGAARGEFVDTEIKAEEINDQVVIYIFRVWLKEYSIAKKEHYNPRPICYILIYKNWLK
jgi:hypothetical protein